MNYKMMGKFMGRILTVEAVFMLPAVLIGLWDREYTVVGAFLLSRLWTSFLSVSRSKDNFLCQRGIGLCRAQLGGNRTAWLSPLLFLGRHSEFCGCFF